MASDNNCVVNDVEDDQAGMNNEISELDNDNSNCAVIGHGIENDGQADDQIDNIGSIQQQQHEPLEWRDSMSAFATSIKEGIIDNTTYKDVRLFLKECLEVLKPVIQGLLKKNNLKVYCVLKNEFELKKEQDKLIKEPKWFNTKAYPIFETTDLDDWFNVHIIEQIENDIDMFIENGSGWRILRIIELSIFISKYLPFKGGGGTYIEIPQQILNTKACINVRNEDNLCFVWSILSAKLDIKKNAQRVNQYKRHLNTLNLNGLTFPLEPKQVKQFERQNPDILVNLYKLQLVAGKYWIHPFSGSKGDLEERLKRNKEGIDLLYIQNIYRDEKESDAEFNERNKDPITYHYVWIKDISAILAKQINNAKYKGYFCKGCFSPFFNEKLLEEHIKYCGEFEACKITLPSNENDILKFTEHKKHLKLPYALANILALNKLSNNGYPEVVKAINLEEKVNHKITNVKIVDTKYGQKIVIDLSYNDKDDVCFYLSSKMGNALLKDVELLDHTNKYANEVYIMSFYVLDVIGFVDNTNALVAKELALMPITYNEDIKTWFFKAPYEWEQLNEKSKKYNEYIVYRDGLEWESGALDYDCVKEVLNKHLIDAKTIFIRHFKVGDWLASYGFKNFCDVSQDPDYNDYNIPICKMTPCLKHTHSILMSCATRNVKKILFNVMLHCQ
uniref:C2H2-type domain-containing protein n=2 Tax=Trichogramma kaykai TaxID=54128 RepID=A0ABD2XI06_9HYME